MAELGLSVTIPDEKVAAVIDGVARQLGWTDEVEDENGEMVPNPVPKGQYVKDHILLVIRLTWKAWNDQIAKDAALAAQDEDGSDFS